MTRRTCRTVPLALALLLGCSGVGRAAPNRASGPPSPGRRSREHSEAPIISEIDIRIGEVFDPTQPEEDRLAFRLANRLHRRTREDVIRHRLLFAVGEALDPARLEETERLLRADAYLYEPRIEAIPVAGDREHVRVLVRARDLWTLDAGVHFSHQGGASRTSFELSDSNFFGTGKDVTLKRSSDVDRTSWGLRYIDPQWRGGRSRVEVEAANSSDGHIYRAETGRPFLSLDDRTSWSAFALDHERDDIRYLRGEALDSMRHREVSAGVAFGFSSGRSDKGRVTRDTFGWTGSHHEFGAMRPPGISTDEELAVSFDSPLPRPVDRRSSALWWRRESFEDDYEEAVNLDQIRRTEDLRLGRVTTWSLGTSLQAFGASRDELLLDVATGWSGHPANHLFLTGSASLGGRWAFGRGDGPDEQATGPVDLRLAVQGSAHLSSRDDRRVTYVGAHFDLVEQPYPETQLLLGGDSGSRGYPLRYQEGTRRALLTIEERFYTPWTLFSLADVGAAAFADVGRAWGRDLPGAADGWLADVGVGLRLGLQRSGTGSVVHLDLAMPLSENDGIKGVQWLVTTRQSF